jgi:zinc protease
VGAILTRESMLDTLPRQGVGMSMLRRLKPAHALLGAALLATACARDSGQPGPATGTAQTPAAYTVPVEYHKLGNGLKVVISEDHSAPVSVIGVYYNIGFRIEPRDRTGFAHLFEHMMFQGSQNLGKNQFIQLVQRNGGILNGSTRFDFTNYFEVVPANVLETMLWAEADRMRGLAITNDNLVNQQGVVGNEVKVNVLNRPYGGWPWLWMPQYANENWYNAHNFYGELSDIEAAKLDEVKKFFSTYYAPNNAALAIVGDVDPHQALEWAEKYFGDIPKAEVPPRPDLTEPKQQKEKVAVRRDPFANRPALAFAYQMPGRGTPAYYAMGLVDQVLLQGDDAWLTRKLAKEKGYTANVGGGINLLGNMFNYNGPMLWTASLIHDANVSDDEILKSVDEVIDRLRDQPVDQKTLDRAVVKARSDLYDTLGGLYGFGRADLLAAFALFDDDPKEINTLEERFRAVTVEQLQATAREYLVPTARTVLKLEPGAVRSDAP